MRNSPTADRREAQRSAEFTQSLQTGRDVADRHDHLRCQIPGGRLEAVAQTAAIAWPRCAPSESDSDLLSELVSEPAYIASKSWDSELSILPPCSEIISEHGLRSCKRRGGPSAGKTYCC